MRRPITALQRLSRSLAGHGRERIRSTDWWPVVVELMIVVAGILIAFELANWGERRERRRAELQLLQRIEEEARGDWEELKNVRADHLQSAENHRLLARAVNDEAAHRAYHRRGRAECNLLRLPAVPRQSSGVGGLAAGERLELISDPELRSLLRKADARRAFSDGQLGYFRDTFHRYAERIEPHMKWRFREGAAHCGVDIDSLKSDPEAVALLPKLFRDQAQFARYRGLEMNATRAVIARVSCLRRGRCSRS